MVNSVNITGRLVRDPELRYTQSNTPVASFSIACDRSFTGKDGERKADFFDCVAWRHTAEFIDKYFSKGRKVIISGSLRQETYQDKDGHNRSSVKILVNEIDFGDSKNGNNSVNGYSDSSQTEAHFEEISGDDSELPF